MSYDYSFLNLHNKRRTIKTPQNPLDICTVVSIFPKPITTRFITCEPNEFFIPAASKEKPSLIHVGSVSWWKDTGPDQPLIEIQVSSPQVAQSILTDSVYNMVGTLKDVRHAGVFFLLGKKQLSEITKADIEKADALQTAWYRELVKMADVDWATSNGNPLVISDDSRLAAEKLGQKDKPWMGDFRAAEMVACTACGSLRNPKFPVCVACHNIIDQKLFDTLGIKKAS